MPRRRRAASIVGNATGWLTPLRYRAEQLPPRPDAGRLAPLRTRTAYAAPRYRAAYAAPL